MKTEKSTSGAEEGAEIAIWNCNQGDLFIESPYHPYDQGHPWDYGDRLIGPSLTPAYAVEFEEHTPNSGGGRNVGWKSYEHYLCRRDLRSTSAAKLPLYGNLPPLGRPHYQMSEWSHPRFGTHRAPGFPEVVLFGEQAGGFPLVGLPAYYVKRPDDGFVPLPDNLADLENRALTSMMPGIKAELSAINSLIELKDFSTLPRTVSNIGSWFYRSYNRTYDRLRHLLKGSADGYLQAKFNILPLLSDISGIHSALSSVEARINELVSGAGRKRVRHWSQTLTEYADPGEQRSEVFQPLGGIPSTELSTYQLVRTVQTQEARFHVMIQYNYMFTEYQTVHAQLLGHLDAFGVNLNPAIIWNAIPWSFVVDWVFGVSRFLDSLKTRNLEPRVNIRRYCWSVARERRIFVHREHRAAYPDLYPVPFAAAPLPVTLERSYRREVKSPSMSSIASSGLNPTEVSLGAALVISRRRRNRNRLRSF